MAVAVADLDGDGDKDILYGTRETVEGGWIPNQGGGVFGSPITLFSPLDRPVWVSSRDIDNDGDRDFLYHEGSGNQSLMVLYSDGDGTFTTFDVIAEGVSSVGNQSFGNAQGLPIILYVTTSGEFRAVVWSSNGFGDYSTYVQYPSIAWGGIANNDATIDVVAWSTQAGPTPTPTLFESSIGESGYEFPDVGASIVAGPALLPVSYSDFNNTQFLEVDAAAGVIRGWTLAGSQYVSETLAENTNQTNGWPAVHLADLDGDCDLDLVRDDFAPAERIVIGWNPLVTGDIDGDGVGQCAGDRDDADPSVGSVANDADCDGTVTAEDCDDDDPASATRLEDGDCDGLLTAEDCDDADPNSNAVFEDRDCDGAVAAEDCDDLDPAALPGAEEICDGIDNDCDGNVDQGLEGSGSDIDHECGRVIENGDDSG